MRVIFMVPVKGLEPQVEDCQWQSEESTLGRQCTACGARRKRRSPAPRTMRLLQIKSVPYFGALVVLSKLQSVASGRSKSVLSLS
jgi:hypothetical protein